MHGHNIPVKLPDPQSVPEAWNVIEESSANVDKLLDARLVRDITFQLANSGAALQWLSTHLTDRDAHKQRETVDGMLTEGSEIITSIQQHTAAPDKIQETWQAYRRNLSELESCYTPETIAAAVYICPMHPLDRHLKPDEKCSICRMSLIRRHLPA